MNQHAQLAASLALMLSACAVPVTEKTKPASAVAEHSQALNLFFEDVFQERLSRSPQRQNSLGIKGDYDQWDDHSPEAKQEEYQALLSDLESMRSQFGRSTLDRPSQLSYQLFGYESEDAIAAHRWRLHDYPVNQMFGEHSNVVSFLSNIHRIDNEDDARDYITRLRGIGPLLAQLRANLEQRQKLGVMPPRFVFPMVIEDCRNIITGRPFGSQGDGIDSVLLADFRKKVAALDSLSRERRDALIGQATSALIEVVRPAYQQLIQLLEAQAAVATTDDGIWKLPDGAEYYAWLLRHHTSTDLSADEIHQLGLAQVARIHGEMQAIIEQVGFEGDRSAFFQFLRDDDRFFYPNTDEGRAAYLARATEIIEAMRVRLDELFITKPRSRLRVKAVEEYRAASAGKAFYNRGAPDGSRPGTYYANLYDMRSMPTYQMEALAYHEGIPGHHMQGSLAMELEGIPMFRRFGNYTSYSEGWGLYSEKVPKEMGFYQDPYSDFGRLAMELWRACRLVVDTGIHHLHWTREQAIEYLRVNTPNPEGDCVNAIERYIVMPGQATAYCVGMLEILKLRADAQAQLGKNFDLREFHEVVLTNGAVPLPILEKLVQEWVTSNLTGLSREPAIAN